jgi:hypothetical protein
MNEIKIYLASPYNDPDLAVREWRFDQACIAAGGLYAKGYIVYAPIAHSHPIAVRYGLPLGWDYWERVDRAFIEWCDEVWVLKIPGWQESRGVRAEIEMAEGMGKPVRTLEP